MRRALPFLALGLLAVACGPKTAATTAPAATPASTPAPAASAATPAPKLTFAQMKPIDAPMLRTKWTPAELTAECDRVEKDTEARFAKLVAIPDAQRTFATSFEGIEDIGVEFSETYARLSFMKDIHPEAAVRDASAACEEKLGKYAVLLASRKDLYLAMKGYLDNAGKKEMARDPGGVGAEPPLWDPEQKRLVEITMRDFKRNGLELPDAQREELIKVRQRITELQTQFQKALGEDKTQIVVTREELEGMPDEWIDERLETKPAKGAKVVRKKTDKVVVTTKYPDYYPVMENAKRESTRKKLEVAFMNRGGGTKNIALLNEAIELRAKAAKILGYETHLDYITEDRMAKDGKTVTAFLERMKAGLRPGLEADAAKMAALKAADTKKKDAKIESHDWRYYMNQIKKRDYAVDDEATRQYFPSDKVTAGLFEVYERLFGLQIEETKGEVWAEGVKLYEVRDSDTSRLVARFYIDYYPREGKYGHAAQFTLTPGHAVTEGYKTPMACLVLNFEKPKDGLNGVANWSIDEVDTFFHEFGHVMHESLTTARYASQAGTSTARDFVEAPSQMLEHWVYSPEVLAMLSRDPKDPSKGMPADLAQKIVAARKYNAGVHYSRQLFLGSFDAKIHTTKKVDADVAAKELWTAIMGFPEDPGSHFAGTFGHMMGGYDGGYYGYLWSEVYAADMFTRFQKEGVLNPKTGREYRDIILAKGRTVEPMDLLRQFLGREPSEEAFLKLIGIKKSA